MSEPPETRDTDAGPGLDTTRIALNVVRVAVARAQQFGITRQEVDTEVDRVFGTQDPAPSPYRAG